MDSPITVDDIQGLMTDLKAIALRLLSREGSAHSLSPTALIMTGLRRYRVSDQAWEEITWKNRHHCFGTLHQMMRRALVDSARRKSAQKRPPLTYVEPSDLDFYDMPSTLQEAPERIVALEEALLWLRNHDPGLVQIIEYHYFSGVQLSELGSMLEISTKTVGRRLNSAKMLLHKKVLEILNTNSSSRGRTE